MKTIKQAKREQFNCYTPIVEEQFKVTIQYTTVYKTSIKDNCIFIEGVDYNEIDWYELEGEEVAREDLVERFGNKAIQRIEVDLK